MLYLKQPILPTIFNLKNTFWEDFYIHVSSLFFILDFSFLDEVRTAKL